MSFEIALILVPVSIAFFLVYVSTTLSNDADPSIDLIKWFLVLCGFIFMWVTAPVGYSIARLNNGSAVTNVTIQPLENIMQTNMIVFTSLLALIIFMYVVFFFWKLFEPYSERGRRRRQ